MNIFVGNLSKETTSQQLQNKFESFGTVDSCKIIKDMHTGVSKGFGFVEISDPSKGNAAIHQLNNIELNGRKITVNEARPRNTNRSYSNRSRF